MIPRQGVILLLATVLAVTIQARPDRNGGPEAGQGDSSAHKLRATGTKPEKEAGEVERSLTKGDEDVNLTPSLRASADATAAITTQQDAIAERTKDLRAAGCTNEYDFTYVPPGNSLTFRNHLKRFTKEKTSICGWWFWTDALYKLQIACDFIDLRPEDYMVIYNVDTDQNLGMAGVYASTDYKETIPSMNVLVGLETTLAREERTFECTILTVDPNEVAFIGGLNASGASHTSVFVQVTPFAVPSVVVPRFSAALAMKDGILYICSGGFMVALNFCQKIDLTVKSAEYELLLEDNQLTLSGSRTLFALETEMWFIVGLTLLSVPYDGTKANDETISSPLPGTAGCGAGDANFRFYAVEEGTDVHYNDDAAAPLVWSTATGSLDHSLRGPCCFYNDETFYIAGGEYDDAEGGVASSNKTYSVNTSNKTVTRLGDLTTAVALCGMGMIDGRVAVIGGVDETNTPSMNAHVLDGQAWVEQVDFLEASAVDPGYLKTGFMF